MSSENKKIWNRGGNPWIAIGFILAAVGVVGTLAAVVLLVIGGAELWMVGFPVAAVVGIVITLRFAVEHAKAMLGIGASSNGGSSSKSTESGTQDNDDLDGETNEEENSS